MKTVQITSPGGPFEPIERELPSPPASWVRVPLAQAAQAYERTMSGKARFRAVLVVR